MNMRNESPLASTACALEKPPQPVGSPHLIGWTVATHGIAAAYGVAAPPGAATHRLAATPQAMGSPLPLGPLQSVPRDIGSSAHGGACAKEPGHTSSRSCNGAQLVCHEWDAARHGNRGGLLAQARDQLPGSLRYPGASIALLLDTWPLSPRSVRLPVNWHDQ